MPGTLRQMLFSAGFITIMFGFRFSVHTTLRRECLDHVLIFGEAHLRKILTLYASYYNRSRTHLSLRMDAPICRSVQRYGNVAATPILSGHIIATRGYDFRKGQENLFLRHQLIIALRREPPRPRLRGGDRALLVWITRIFSGLLDLAQVVKLEIILRWHRAGFKVFWHWNPEIGQGGRRSIAACVI